jgi:hypothetical protein
MEARGIENLMCERILRDFLPRLDALNNTRHYRIPPSWTAFEHLRAASSVCHTKIVGSSGQGLSVFQKTLPESLAGRRSLIALVAKENADILIGWLQRTGRNPLHVIDLARTGQWGSLSTRLRTPEGQRLSERMRLKMTMPEHPRLQHRLFAETGDDGINLIEVLEGVMPRTLVIVLPGGPADRHACAGRAALAALRASLPALLLGKPTASIAAMSGCDLLLDGYEGFAYEGLAVVLTQIRPLHVNVSYRITPGAECDDHAAIELSSVTANTHTHILFDATGRGANKIPRVKTALWRETALPLGGMC